MPSSGPDKRETQPGYHLTGQVVKAQGANVGDAYMRPLQRMLPACTWPFRWRVTISGQPEKEQNTASD